MREMTADWSRRESASTTHLPFNIFLFQTLFQINFCSVPIFSSDLRSVYDHVIENDNFKNVFPCFRFTFCNEEHICIDIHVQKRSEAKFKEQKNLMAWKEVSFKKQIMTKNKYTSIFSRKIEAIVFLILILKLLSKNVFEQLAVSCVGCFHLSVLWYDFINKQIFSFFFNNHV